MQQGYSKNILKKQEWFKSIFISEGKNGLNNGGNCYAISRLNVEERDIIERLYFNDETVRSVAKLKSITHPALIKRRNKILEKLKKFIEEL